MKRKARGSAYRIFGTVVVVAVAFLGAASGSRGTGPLFDVTDLGPGVATGMNDAGHVIYFSQSTGHSYLWDNGTTTDMGAFSALAINDSDVVVGGQGRNPVEWTSGGGLVTLPLPGGWDTGSATAINASGVATGSVSSSGTPGEFHAVVWTSPGSAPTDLDGSITNTCQTSKGHGINASGQIAAEGSYSTVANCFLGTSGAAYLLGPGAGATQLTAAGARGVAQAINDSGAVVGYMTVSGDQRAFMYDGALHDLGLTNSQANAINSAGDIVGFGGSPSHGWLDRNGTVTNLDQVAFVSGLVPVAINSSGQIAGRTLGLGAHAYLLTPVNTNADLAASLSHSPEPSTMDAGTLKAHVAWTATLTNNGPAEADDAKLTVTLPSGFSLSPGGLDSRCTGPGPFTCVPAGGTLASGAHVDFTIAADASAPLSTNATATASTTSPDPNSGNDTATDGTTVQPPPPTIARFSPASARVGASVTVTGTYLGTATSVQLSGVGAQFTVVSQVQLTFTVPPGARSGQISVTTPSGSTSSTGTMRVPLAPPVVQAISPQRGQVGATVTIAGSNFTGATRVAFNGTPAVYAVVSDSRVTAQVPVGATTGQVSVTTFAGTGRSWTPFVVVPAAPPPPAISWFWPASGVSGVNVTLHGSGLLGATSVTFNGVPASFRVVRDAALSAVVPPLATTGQIAVTTPSGTGTSSQVFVVRVH